MLKTRYIFIKKLYPEYLIVFKVKTRIYIPVNERIVIKYRECDLYTWLNNKHINYIVLDNLNIIIKKEFEDNKYKLYLKKGLLKKVIESNNRYWYK